MDTTIAQSHVPISSKFRDLRDSAPVVALMKPHDRSFYAHCVFVAFCMAGVIWLLTHAPLTVATAISYGFLAGIVHGWTGHLGHDVGHNQAPKRNRNARYAFQVLIGPFLLGFSSLWWVAKHVTHHNNPNVEGKDTDINLPLISFTSNQLREREIDPDSFQAKQARWIFLCLLPLQAMNARWSSFKFLRSLDKKRLGNVTEKHNKFTKKADLAMRFLLERRDKTIEGVGITTHFILYGLLLFVIARNSDWQTATTFALTHQFTHGFYNACVFATNHKGMPTLPLTHGLDWAMLQILTARNVELDWEIFQWKYGWIVQKPANAVVDFMYGGLNLQIEHHLFPSMPRANLRKVRPFVIEFCRENGIEYYQTGIIRSYKEVLQNFETVRLELLESPMGA